MEGDIPIVVDGLECPAGMEGPLPGCGGVALGPGAPVSVLEVVMPEQARHRALTRPDIALSPVEETPLALVRDADRGKTFALEIRDWSAASSLFRSRADGEQPGRRRGRELEEEPGPGSPRSVGAELPEPEPEETYAGPPRLLPAGVYWHSQGFDPCRPEDECPMPRAAVVAGQDATPSAALRRARRHEGLELAAGYPLLAHTDELGVPESTPAGVRVVLGLFETDAEAHTFRREMPEPSALGVVQVSDPYRRHPDGGWQPRQVIRIDPRGADAYSAPDLERIQRLGNEEAARRAVSRLQPLCTLDGGQAFVVESLAAALLDTTEGRWIRVRCGTRPAYVRITDSLFAAAVFTEPEGTAELVQVVDVECDMADLETWRYTEHGRESLDR